MTFFLPHYFTKKRKGERETLMQEGSIDWSPPLSAYTVDGKHLCPFQGSYVPVQGTEPAA